MFPVGGRFGESLNVIVVGTLLFQEGLYCNNSGVSFFDESDIAHSLLC